jgi:hypothetical protein
MDELRRKIQSNQLFAIGACLALGIALYFGYWLFRSVLSPLVIYIGGNLIDPYSSNNIWLITAFLNISYSAVCGLLIAILILSVMQYLLKPTIMFYTHISALPYVILSYWWFVSDVSGFIKVASKEHIWITLLSPLTAILMWFLCSWWLIRKNTPNKGFNSDAAKDAAAG